jgi:pimeloyl-ACP methyl ester carboxylesterase
LELAAGIKDANLRIFEHSGHSPFIEETERFGNEISSFLELKS